MTKNFDDVLLKLINKYLDFVDLVYFKIGELFKKWKKYFMIRKYK